MNGHIMDVNEFWKDGLQLRLKRLQECRGRRHCVSLLLCDVNYALMLKGVPIPVMCNHGLKDNLVFAVIHGAHFIGITTCIVLCIVHLNCAFL